MRLKLIFATILLAVPAGAALRAGAASVKITPPVGMPMAGYYYNRAAEGTHDDLWAKALVLDDGGSRAALVACDLIGIPDTIVHQARELIEKQTGIPAAAVMISGTHTHTSPVLDAQRYNLPAEALELTRRYTGSLPGRIAESVRLAAAALVPATVSAGTGHEDSISFNRRYFMSDGSVGWNPGKLNPKIVKPAGPIDPDVAVLYFEAPASQPLATYVNFAMHLDTTGGLYWSADYPYTLATLLGRLRGAGMLTLFSIGCAGNINHVDVRTRDPQKGFGEAARLGTVLAGEVLKTYPRLKPVTPGKLWTRNEIVPLPLAPIAPGEVEKSRAIAATFGQPNAAPFLALVRAARVLDVAAREGKPLPAEVQVIALGRDLAWVGLPGEIFTELGQAIKTASPFRQTVVVELANGSFGYIPNREAYPQGNYEPVSARCAAGSGEMLVNKALELLRAAAKQVE